MTTFKDWTPHGVIPAVLLPFHPSFSIDQNSYRKHLRDVAAVEGILAITVKAIPPRSTPARSRSSAKFSRSRSTKSATGCR